ncbi:hypothetical protein ACF0H5_007399 [Mactra antiquata]
MADYKNLSIDEVAVSPSRLDTLTAVQNFKKFQQHIVHEFGTAMASGKNLHADRQRSVTEEELFGDGTNNKPDNKTDENITNTVIEFLSKESDKANAAVGGEIDLPIFSMIVGNSSSGSESYEKKSTEEDVKMRKEKLLEETDTESSDFKMRYMSNRSISDVHERRRNFRNSGDIEVFDDVDFDEHHDETIKKQVRKSNSLPGRVESSLSPLSPPNNFCTDPSKHHDIECSDESSMKKSLEKKITLEGPSVKPAIKTSDSQKPKLHRRVSFMDDNQNDQNSENLCMTPTDERRGRFRSSGYGTGSGNSQELSEKNDGKRKMSQTSQALSDVWMPQDSEKAPVVNETAMEEGDVASFEVESNAGIDQMLDKNDIGSFHKSQETVETYGKPGSKSIENMACEYNCEFQRLKSEDEGVRTTNFKYRKTNDPSSYGNMPNFSTLEDESMVLRSSAVARVINEENKNIRAVIKNYCRSTSSSSPGSAPCTGISDMSSYKKTLSHQPCPLQDVEKFERMLLHYSPNEVLGQLHEDPTSPCSPSPTPNNWGILPSQNFNALDLLEASRCDDINCDRIICMMLHKVLSTIGLDGLESDQYELHNHYYQALFTHNAECDEVKCPVQFCQDINEWRKNSLDSFCVESMGNIIQKHLTSPCMNVVLENKYTLLMLQKTGKKSTIEDFQTYIPLFPHGKFGNAVVCKDVEADSMVVITKYPLMDYKHQLSLYTRILDLSHPNIVKQLWLLEYEERIQVCTAYTTGGNLKDYLTSVGLLPWQLAVVYMRQILSAISHLHSDKYGVVYLYWCAENLLFTDYQRRVIQIGNFGLACPLGCRLDYGSLKSCLPYSICPPELIKDNIVDSKSDCWGAGCILFEMLTGSSYLHELRHDNQSDVHDKVKQGTRPILTGLKSELVEILESWWQVDRNRRQSIDMTLRKLYAISLKVP